VLQYKNFYCIRVKQAIILSAKCHPGSIKIGPLKSKPLEFVKQVLQAGWIPVTCHQGQSTEEKASTRVPFKKVLFNTCTIIYTHSDYSGITVAILAR